MNITLYSTGCSRCTILETKLKQKNINYNLVTDVNTMSDMGFTSVPMLLVDNNLMDFGEAIRWINGVE